MDSAACDPETILFHTLVTLSHLKILAESHKGLRYQTNACNKSEPTLYFYTSPLSSAYYH